MEQDNDLKVAHSHDHDCGAHCHEDHEEEKWGQALSQLRRTAKIGRNEPCPCGSGKKHKKCCLR